VTEGVGLTVVVIFLVVVVVVVYLLVTVAVAVPDLRMLLQNRSASEVWPSNASRPQSSTDVRISSQCYLHSGIRKNDRCNGELTIWIFSQLLLLKYSRLYACSKRRSDEDRELHVDFSKSLGWTRYVFVEDDARRYLTGSNLYL
jgi:hypothetical protein